MNLNTEASMPSKKNDLKLPDVSLAQKTQYSGKLAKVGMAKIEMPVRILLQSSQTPVLIPALVNAFVSLDAPEAKGIHMSRLYLELKRALTANVISAKTIKELLQSFIKSHAELSHSAFVEVMFNMPLERKALVSGEVGYRHYPVQMRGELKGKNFSFVLGTEVVYSSTCPCSTALAKQIVREEFLAQHAGQDMISRKEVANWLSSDESSVAFPHAQRSIAKVQIKSEEFSVVDLIDSLENALGTPVQSAVKRADEQEFARLNAANLMFCEDAARKLRQVLEKNQQVDDYYIYVEHQESLHPHDAVSVVVKGIEGGFTA